MRTLYYYECMDQQPWATPPQPSGGMTPNYDFIVNPTKPKGHGFNLGKDPFITKIVFILGGAVVLMVAIWLIVTLAFSGSSNTAAFVSLSQRGEEIVRLGALGTDASSQAVKNAAMITQLTVKSQQVKILASLKAEGRELKSAELALKKDTNTDSRLQQAKQTSTFDNTYTEIMRAQLTAYAGELKTAFDNESNNMERQVLASHYNDVQLLLTAWAK